MTTLKSFILKKKVSKSCYIHNSNIVAMNFPFPVFPVNFHLPVLNHHFDEFSSRLWKNINKKISKLWPVM